MRIEEVASKLRLSTEAVRFYERRGLIPPPRRGADGFRDYDDDDFERLRLLHGLRRLEVPLAEAARLAVMCAAGACDEVSDELRRKVRQQRAEIKRRVAELRHLDQRLQLLDGQLAAGELPQRAIRDVEDDFIG